MEDGGGWRSGSQSLCSERLVDFVGRSEQLNRVFFSQFRGNGVSYTLAICIFTKMIVSCSQRRMAFSSVSAPAIQSSTYSSFSMISAASGNSSLYSFAACRSTLVARKGEDVIPKVSLVILQSSTSPDSPDIRNRW